MLNHFINLAERNLREAYAYLSGLNNEEKEFIIKDQRVYEIVKEDLLNNTDKTPERPISFEIIASNDYLYNNSDIIQLSTTIFPEIYKLLLEVGPENIIVDKKALINLSLSLGCIWYNPSSDHVVSQLMSYFKTEEFWLNMLSGTNDADSSLQNFKNVYKQYAPLELKRRFLFIKKLYKLNSKITEEIIFEDSVYHQFKQNLILFISDRAEIITLNNTHRSNIHLKIYEALKFSVVRDFEQFSTSVKSIILKMANIRTPEEFLLEQAILVLQQFIENDNCILEKASKPHRKDAIQFLTDYQSKVKNMFNNLLSYNDTQLNLYHDIEVGVWYLDKPENTVSENYIHQSRLMIFKVLYDKMKQYKLLKKEEQNKLLEKMYIINSETIHVSYEEERIKRFEIKLKKIIKDEHMKLLNYSSDSTKKYYHFLSENHSSVSTIINRTESVKFNNLFFNHIK
jgi:hypothetical protein